MWGTVQPNLKWCSRQKQIVLDDLGFSRTHVRLRTRVSLCFMLAQDVECKKENRLRGVHGTPPTVRLREMETE